MNLRLRLPAFAVLGALLLSACGFPAGDAALVDGIPISDTTLEARIPAVSLLQELQGGSCGMSATGEPPAPGDAEAACARQTLGLLIQGQIMRNLAREQGAEVTDSDLELFRGAIIDGAGGQEEYDKLLKEKGVTQEQVNGLLSELGLFAVLQRTWVAKEIPEEELRKQYEENKSQFTTIDTAHILVDTEEEAQAILDEVTPENFADIAKKESKDPGSEENGGELGAQTAAGFVPEFANAAIAAEPDTIIGPVKSSFGWHIIWVHSVDTLPFDQAKDQLLNNDEGAMAAFQEMLLAAYREADVQVNPRYGRWDATADPPDVVPITSTNPSAVPSSPASEPSYPPPGSPTLAPPPGPESPPIPPSGEEPAQSEPATP